ncbi:MAG: ester cyclase [Beijerinckiaceae bacterium]
MSKPFTSEYANLTDYILGITYRIWEEKGVGLIRRYYGKDCTMLTQGGWVKGVEAVVSGTLETLAQFPDRQLYGEDVVWADHGPKRGMLSSHRLLTTGTHNGDGLFGPPTGKNFAIRAVADCLVKAGTEQITEEWLVRDTGGIAAQLGFDVREMGFRLASADAAKGTKPWHFGMWDDVRAGRIEKHAIIQKHPAAELARHSLHAIVNEVDVGSIRRTHDRASSLHGPMHRLYGGVDGTQLYWLCLLASLPDARLVIDHSIALEEPGRPVRTSTRWRLAGTHSGHGSLGPASGAKVLILGITQAHVWHGRIQQEWTVVDELAVQRMIGLQRC